MGNAAPRARRFRINPVELVIFSAVTLIFVNSVYHLFYDWNAFQYTVLMEPKGEDSLPAGRRPATVSPHFANLELGCDSTAQKATGVEKIRLTGPICGKEGTTPAQLVRTEIVNSSNETEATVFTDTNAGKFSTDYLPLNPGLNEIHIRFVYQGGDTVTGTLSVMRTEDDKERRPAGATK